MTRTTGRNRGYAGTIRRRRLRSLAERGQTAIVTVLALMLLMTATTAYLFNTIVGDAPLLTLQASQIYAYRAMETGVNSLLVALNSNPSLAVCSSLTNGTGRCGGLNFESWTQVDPGTCASGTSTSTSTTSTTSAAGCNQDYVKSYFAYGDPQPTFVTTGSLKGSLAQLTVQVSGAAYSTGTAHHYVFSSASVTYKPVNGFLDHVWWSNYESFNSSGNQAGCQYNWKDSYNVAQNQPGGCHPVYFAPGDYLNGPVWTNDSIYVYNQGAGGPYFGDPGSGATTQVQTADPNCLFVAPDNQTGVAGSGMDGSDANCSAATGLVGGYDTTTSSFANAVQTPPQSNSQLGTIASQDGCLYEGPTEVTLVTATSGGSNVGEMQVSSPDTPTVSMTYNGNTVQTSKLSYSSTNKNYCPVRPVDSNGSAVDAPLPDNGVVYAQNDADSVVTGSNPFDNAEFTTATNISASTSSFVPATPVTLTATVAPTDGTGTVAYSYNQTLQDTSTPVTTTSTNTYTCTVRGNGSTSCLATPVLQSSTGGTPVTGTPTTSSTTSGNKSISGCSAQTATSTGTPDYTLPNITNAQTSTFTCATTVPATPGTSTSTSTSTGSRTGTSWTNPYSCNTRFRAYTCYTYTYTVPQTTTVTTSVYSTTAISYSAAYSGSFDNTYLASQGVTGTTTTPNPVGTNGPDAQTQPTCTTCYYGSTSSPDIEGDVFVSGKLSGQLTIGAQNDVIVDGSITYSDCSWTGTASQSVCPYNTTTQSGTVPINDTLGLIAQNFVDINRPLASDQSTVLPNCGTSGASPAPMCDPVDPSTGNVTIDGAALALTESVVVDNYTQPETSPPNTSSNLLVIYGSLQENARGPVGLIGYSGFTKHYTWDPLLDFLAPPSYLTPTTASYALNTAAVPSQQVTSSGCPTFTSAYGSGTSTQITDTCTHNYGPGNTGSLPNYA